VKKRRQRKRRSRLRSGKKRLGVAGPRTAEAERLAEEIQEEGIFSGEVMTCVVCGAKRRSHPAVESDWRCVIVDGERFYVCPDEFPPDGAGREEDFREAYKLVLTKVLSVRGKRIKEQLHNERQA
jgi:hypothetical protein